MDDVIIVGSLDKKELEKSIQDLVDYVGNKTNVMASKFTEGLDKMKLAMKDFAITQKVSVDTMQEAWRKMSQSFDAMVAAQSAGSRGGSSGGGGKNGAYPDNTVGQLQEMIRLEEQRRKNMQLNSDELRQQNKLLEQQKSKLKEQTTSTDAVLAKMFQKKIGDVVTLPSKTYADANEKLRRLRDLLNEIQQKPFLFSESQINRVKNAIDSVETKIQRMRNKWGQQGSQPNTLQQVLGMDENSFDSISKKMSALKKLSWTDSKEQKQIIDEYQRLRQEQNRLLASNAQMTHSNNMLAQSFGYIRNRVVYALTLGAMTSFVKQVYEIRGQYELLERSLGVLVGSFERGTQIFKELNQMAIESPFTLMELAGAAKQLTAYNFEAKEVVDTTRRLADISAALGVPMERLTYNLGQIRAQTVLTARDARDFANAGLPIVAELAKHYTELEGRIVTTGDVYNRMSKKMVSYADVMSVINKVTDEGGKFFEFQAKQAETLRVQMANLTLAWNNMLNEIGSSNQSLLTLPIKGLKALLQNWSSIDRVIKSLVVSFGLLKIAQMLAVNRFGVLATGLTTTAKQMGMLTNAAKSLWGSLTALAANPWTWVMVGITAFVDLAMQIKRFHEEIVSLNNDIKKNAAEASESMLDFLGNKGNRETYTLAKQNALTTEQGEKAWEGIQAQIEQSAMSSNKLIAELLQIEDINERVKVGFDYISNIQKAQAALQDLKDTTIEFTSDIGWGGMFGEGVVSDLKDYARALEMVNEGFSLWDRLQFETKNTRQGDVVRMGKEFADELAVTAESINNFINAYNITDPLQINEIYERVKAQIKARNPEIKGELAHIFDIGLDQQMAQLTNNAIDSNTSLWNIFMERLRHNSSSTFQDITDDWVNNKQKTLSKAQQEAVDKNLEYFKNSMPYAYDAVAQMVKDASQLKIHIGITFGSGGLSDFQKEVQKRISQAPSMMDFGSNALLPTNQQDLTKWVEARRNDIKKLEADNKTYEQDNTEWAKEHINNNNTQINQNKNLLDLFHQSHKTQKEIDAENRKANAANRKANAAQKHEIDEVATAIKDELSIVKEIQSNYDKLRKAGVSNYDAINMASQGYETTLLRINNVLQKYGIDKFNASDFAGKNVKQLLDSLTRQRDSLIASGKVKTSSLKDLDVEIQKLTIDAKAYDMKKLTDGLNNELGKLKEEYELGIELDANPELGDVFADMMGIDESELRDLPRTFNQVVTKMQASVDKLFAENNINQSFDLTTMLDKSDFDKWAKEQGQTLDSAFVKSLNSIREYANKVRLDEAKAATKNWSGLVEKYGDLQSRIIKIYKETVQEQLSIIRQFGDDSQQSQALDIVSRIKISSDPQEIARLQAELADVLSKVTSSNKVAANVASAAFKMQDSKIASATWGDFKDSDLYTMTFEDMSNNSTHAIQLIIDKLETLKNQVKEDPASMKALMQSLKQAQSELESRDPYLAITSSIREMRQASAEAKLAQQELADATKEVEAAQRELDESEDANPEMQAKARERLTLAIQRQSNAEIKVVQAENKQQKAYKKLQNGLQGLSGQLENVQGLFTSVAKLFEAAGDDDTAEAINAISEGFSVMTTVIMGVVAAMIVLQSTSPYLLAIAAALSVIIGLVSFLSGNNNKKITEQVEASERAVKRLEIAYVDLQHAIDNAYGTSVVGAKKAAQANKELQLEELRRQLILEKSRDSKDRDDDKILDLQKNIKELQYEIMDMTNEIVNDLMGVSSVGEFAENLVESMIDAFREGEDYMEVFEGKFEEMIDNMIMKSIVSRVMTQYMDNLWESIDKRITSRSEKEAEAYAEAQLRNSDIKNMNDMEVLTTFGGYSSYDAFMLQQSNASKFKSIADEYRKAAADAEKSTKQALDSVSAINDSDISWVMEQLGQTTPELAERLKELISQYYSFGDKADPSKNLSGLQQGIQSVTEETAGALEAYMNSVSQQVYLHSDLLTQIRDAVVGFDLDVQTATVSQILLQLQNSYQVQMSIQSILSGWSNPSGMAMRVEMVS